MNIERTTLRWMLLNITQGNKIEWRNISICLFEIFSIYLVKYQTSIIEYIIRFLKWLSQQTFNYDRIEILKCMVQKMNVCHFASQWMKTTINEYLVNYECLRRVIWITFKCFLYYNEKRKAEILFSSICP